MTRRRSGAWPKSWNTLLRASASDTIFLTWEWAWSWWTSYGQANNLRILIIYDEANTLRGIVPLHRRTQQRHLQTVDTLAFIGDGSHDSDYLDIIAEKGYEPAIVDAIFRHLENEVLILNGAPEASPVVSLLCQGAASRGWLCAEVATPCSTVKLPDKWDSYLANLRPRFRTKVRSVLRNLESRPEVRFRRCASTEGVDQILPALFELHKRRWQHEGQPGVFGGPAKRTFYSLLSNLLSEREWLYVTALDYNGTPLACQYGFVYNNTYFHLQEGYEPDSEHWSVGLGLRAWSIRNLLDLGVREYDFLGGAGRHKSDWGSEIKRSKHVSLARNTYRNRVFCYGPQWEADARDRLKEVLPVKVIALRQTIAGAHRKGWNGSSRWLPNAAAKLYWNLGLSSVAKRVSRRYQVSDNGFGLKPRAAASARIFCYHRVNNNEDPFFPAMPVEQFDQQIEYISRYHNVVSLRDLLTRLDDGCAEPMIAVTFDDGYRDNYENALPVLERYGVPATIFLATGVIDSGQPLWFEELAGKLKTTTLEFLDVELGVPRRFLLRTEGDRLDTNRRLLELLRMLPDHLRHNWLREILRELGGASGEPRGNMLTWDQVREMTGRGIAFGGHTVTHPFLSKTTDDQMAWEVSECKRQIERMSQREVEHFAYPNGREEDFIVSSKRLLKQAGYRAAVTTIWGHNDGSTDPMELRRSGPWERDPALFACKLDWYQLSNR